MHLWIAYLIYTACIFFGPGRLPGAVVDWPDALPPGSLAGNFLHYLRLLPGISGVMESDAGGISSPADELDLHHISMPGCRFDGSSGGHYAGGRHFRFLLRPDRSVLLRCVSHGNGLWHQHLSGLDFRNFRVFRCRGGCRGYGGALGCRSSGRLDRVATGILCPVPAHVDCNWIGSGRGALQILC